jgi:hypothetical protein
MLTLFRVHYLAEFEILWNILQVYY